MVLVDADTHDAIKKQVKDVEELLAHADLLYIHTSTITVGVNYTPERYHYLYVHASACSNSPRDSIQGMHRVRTFLKDDIYLATCPHYNGTGQAKVMCRKRLLEGRAVCAQALEGNRLFRIRDQLQMFTKLGVVNVNQEGNTSYDAMVTNRHSTASCWSLNMHSV